MQYRRETKKTLWGFASKYSSITPPSIRKLLILRIADFGGRQDRLFSARINELTLRRTHRVRIFKLREYLDIKSNRSTLVEGINRSRDCQMILFCDNGVLLWKHDIYPRPVLCNNCKVGKPITLLSCFGGDTSLDKRLSGCCSSDAGLAEGPIKQSGTEHP